MISGCSKLIHARGVSECTRQVGFVLADRVLYLPSMGMCFLVAHLVCGTMLSPAPARNLNAERAPSTQRRTRAQKAWTSTATLLALVAAVARTLQRNKCVRTVCQHKSRRGASTRIIVFFQKRACWSCVLLFF